MTYFAAEQFCLFLFLSNPDLAAACSCRKQLLTRLPRAAAAPTIQESMTATTTKTLKKMKCKI
jgi:hypothetical protein